MHEGIGEVRETERGDSTVFAAHLPAQSNVVFEVAKQTSSCNNQSVSTQDGGGTITGE